MKIDRIQLSIFEAKSNSNLFKMREIAHGPYRQWVRESGVNVTDEIHVLHVHTDEGIEGICTVGDARYRTMRVRDLEQLRLLAIGEDPFDRERLYDKLYASTRGVFGKQGWFGAFDNCLWDIAGKAAGLPVYALIGRARERCPAYFNISGGHLSDLDMVMESAHKAVDAGFPALKDHFRDTAVNNIKLYEALRKEFGDKVDLITDAASTRHTLREAIRVGRALEALDYVWFEEPLPDPEMASLQKLCAAVDVPILACETLMHDPRLCAQYIISGATDWLRVNARHGVTSQLKLAHLADMHGARVEFNGPGGLFGLVHAHMVVAVRNTSYYEKFGGISRDLAGKAIGLMNPAMPVNGYVAPPDAPGWGAEWDWALFERERTAIL